MIEVEASAPGKVILHGEHAVVYGTKAIAISVGLNTVVKISKSSSNSVKLLFKEVGIDTELSVEELETLRNQFLQLSDFTFNKLNSEQVIPINPSILKCLETFVNERALLNCKEELKVASKSAYEAFIFLYLAIFEDLTPFKMEIKTELPVGAGLGSSASFGVALAGSLLISSGRMKKELIDRDLVNRWAFTSESFVHGNPSGLDNSVATFGGAILFKKGEPLVHLTCSEIRVLLVNTEVPRSTKELVARVANLKENDPKLHGTIMKEINELVENVVDELKLTGQTKPEYVSRNQELLKQLNVSHPKIDLIVEIAQTHNLSAKLTGAGGGGCVFIQIPANFSEELLQRIKRSLIENKLEQFWFITLGGDGFTIKI